MGGTEVYVEALAREQQRRGLSVAVAAARPSETTTHHVDAGLPVYRFASSLSRDVAALYGYGDSLASRAFATIVETEKPDVVHLHAFTSAVSARLAHAARQLGAQVVFTYHTPTVSCQRGTLLRWGKDVCDGVLDAQPCAACTLHTHGLTPRAASLAGRVPTRLGKLVGHFGLSGGGWTAIRMNSLVQDQHTAFRALMCDADRIVVLCEWSRELLVRNGVPPDKLVLSRHGLPTVGPARPTPPRAAGPLRIAFLGRLHPTKGVDVLLRAMAALRSAEIQLDVFGIADGHDDYACAITALADQDPRVRLRRPVPSTEVTALLGNYDVLAVPSRWLETGPLVVLEAFAAGVPVVGSRLGGIAELVEDGVTGLLVEPESVAQWTDALRRLADEPHLLRCLRRGIRPPRGMAAVADDMQTVYAERHR
jgi:glycosyltransferase involved in cell wall biosynthesis